MKPNILGSEPKRAFSQRSIEIVLICCTKSYALGLCDLDKTLSDMKSSIILYLCLEREIPQNFISCDAKKKDRVVWKAQLLRSLLIAFGKPGVVPGVAFHGYTWGLLEFGYVLKLRKYAITGEAALGSTWAYQWRNRVE